MTLVQPKRGRPKGSGINDTASLDAIADMLLASPSMRKTTAIKRLRPYPSNATIRRLQAKWVVEGDTFMQAAVRRAQVSSQPRASSSRYSGGYSVSATAQMEEEVSKILAMTRNSDLERITGVSAANSTLQALEESSLMRTIRAIEDTPAMRVIRALENSPAMKAVREVERIENMYRDLGY